MINRDLNRSEAQDSTTLLSRCKQALVERHGSSFAYSTAAKNRREPNGRIRQMSAVGPTSSGRRHLTDVRASIYINCYDSGRLFDNSC